MAPQISAASTLAGPLFFAAMKVFVLGVASVLCLVLFAGPGRAEVKKRSSGDEHKSKAKAADCDCEEPKKEKGPWSGSFSLGLSVAVGEDNVVTGSTDFHTLYDLRPHRMEITMNGFYSVKNSENNANRQYGQVEYRYYFLKQWYAYGATSAERNLQQDLRFRFATTAGPGYQILDRNRPFGLLVKKDSASVQIGAGYQYQRLSAPGEADVTSDAVFQLTINQAMTLRHSITWVNRVGFVLPPMQTDYWRVLGSSTLNIPVFGTLGLQAQVTIDYLNGPILAARGNLKLTAFGSLGVSYSF